MVHRREAQWLGGEWNQVASSTQIQSLVPRLSSEYFNGKTVVTVKKKHWNSEKKIWFSSGTTHNALCVFLKTYFWSKLPQIYPKSIFISSDLLWGNCQRHKTLWVSSSIHHPCKQLWLYISLEYHIVSNNTKQFVLPFNYADILKMGGISLCHSLKIIVHANRRLLQSVFACTTILANIIG